MSTDTQTKTALEQENIRLRGILEQAQQGEPIILPVDGTFIVERETPTGEIVKQEWGFKPGRIRVALAEGAQVSSSALIRIANGGQATEQERARFLPLRTITQEEAQQRLEYLVHLGASFLEQR